MIAASIKETICEALNINQEQFIEYPSSYIEYEEGQFLICKVDGTKKILAMGRGEFFSQLDGMYLSETIKLCPLSHQNRLILNKYLP